MELFTTIFFVVLFLAIGTIAKSDKSNNYVFVITVENRSDDEGEKILDKLEKFCEDNKIKFDLYTKKDFDRRMMVPLFKLEQR